MSFIAFIVMAAVTLLFMVATLAGEWQFKWSPPRQIGDSSLGRQSVNWLGAIALIGAILICLA